VGDDILTGRPVAEGSVEPSVEDFETLVIGLGNKQWADEGFGIRAVEALNAAWTFPPGVRVMDGGTQGIFLLPWVRTARSLLILDAIDFGLSPGELKLIEGDDVPRFMGVRKVSMHQAGFQEVLMSAQLSGEFPERIALVGVQPELLDDYGGSLRACVREQVEPAVALAISVLRRWGIAPEPRAEQLPRRDHVGPDELNIEDYEQGRPARREG
jgi:hydrogenase maturation protease